MKNRSKILPALFRRRFLTPGCGYDKLESRRQRRFEFRTRNVFAFFFGKTRKQDSSVLKEAGQRTGGFGWEHLIKLKAVFPADYGCA